jgi:hypothetical protein
VTITEIQVYRRQNPTLKLAATLLAGDEITSPLLPNFVGSVATSFR